MSNASLGKSIVSRSHRYASLGKSVGDPHGPSSLQKLTGALENLYSRDISHGDRTELTINNLVPISCTDTDDLIRLLNNGLMNNLNNDLIANNSNFTNNTSNNLRTKLRDRITGIHLLVNRRTLLLQLGIYRICSGQYILWKRAEIEK